MRLTDDQCTVLEFIAAEYAAGGFLPASLPFKLDRFRNLRGNLVRDGLVRTDDRGRYVPQAEADMAQAFVNAEMLAVAA